MKKIIEKLKFTFDTPIKQYREYIKNYNSKNIGIIKEGFLYTIEKKEKIKDEINYDNILNLENNDDINKIFRIYNDTKYYNKTKNEFNKKILRKVNKKEIFHGTNKNINKIEKEGLNSGTIFYPIFFSTIKKYSENYHSKYDKNNLGYTYNVILAEGTDYICSRDITYLHPSNNIEDFFKYIHLLSKGKIFTINYLRGIEDTERDWYLIYNPGYIKISNHKHIFIYKYIYRIFAYIEGLKLIKKLQIYNRIIQKYTELK